MCRPKKRSWSSGCECFIVIGRWFCAITFFLLWHRKQGWITCAAEKAGVDNLCVLVDMTNYHQFFGVEFHDSSLGLELDSMRCESGGELS